MLADYTALHYINGLCRIVVAVNSSMRVDARSCINVFRTCDSKYYRWDSHFWWVTSHCPTNWWVFLFKTGVNHLGMQDILAWFLCIIDRHGQYYGILCWDQFFQHDLLTTLVENVMGPNVYAMGFLATATIRMLIFFYILSMPADFH